jgi:putative spermidine/putrescine transport system permease protein
LPQSTVSPTESPAGPDLQRVHRKVERRLSLRSWSLVAPLFLFVTIMLLVPVGMLLMRSFYDPLVANTLPRTLAELETWDPAKGPPSEAAFAALREDLIAALEQGTLGPLAGRLNQDAPGARSLLIRTARQIGRAKQGPYRPVFEASGSAWKDIALWGAIRNAGSRYTLNYFLGAIDMTRDPSGKIVQRPDDQRLSVKLFIRTLWVSAVIALSATLLAYPIAFLMARLPDGPSNFVMMLVLLPFWTSVLVRITSWIVLLQRQGVVNDFLVWSGLLSDAERLDVMYSLKATLIVGTHILFPFAVLPIYSVMKSIPDNLMRAAISLGASPLHAFRKIYLPISLPGLAASMSIVFILSVGYYITPAIVGGASGDLISNLIAFNMQMSLNWGLASAISIVLLIVVGILYLTSNKLLATKH